MSKVYVIGGGPAGMMAAISAAEKGHQVTLLERNEKLGKKLFITGKGRCNITNACDIEELFPNVIRNRRFLYSAFYTFSNDQMMNFLEENGLKIKTERGNRVFPESDHSSDVIATLKKVLEQKKVKIVLHERVKELVSKNGRIKEIVLSSGKREEVDAVVLATGGLSYKTTGSDGDGFAFAKKLGHTITECSPSLVPIEAKESYVKELQGLSLRNVSIKIKDSGKIIYEEFGEMLFTHYGVSGPLVLSASSVINDNIRRNSLDMTIDLKPALTEKQLDERILRDFEENRNRQFKNSLGKLLPAKMIPVMIELSEINPEEKINEITREQRNKLVEIMKNFPLTLTKLRDYNEAIITRGGIDVKEVNASSMESKKIKGLFFAGEILDLDAVTGGFNLQIAWSTGYLAGISIE